MKHKSGKWEERTVHVEERRFLKPVVRSVVGR